MASSHGRPVRMYGIYAVFAFILISVAFLLGMTQEALPMQVFIRDMACSNDSGSVVIQSWDYNDYPLPDVSLEISNMGDFVTGEDGTWAMDGLANGTYDVSASKIGYERKSFSFAISCPMKKIVIMPSPNIQG